MRKRLPFGLAARAGFPAPENRGEVGPCVLPGYREDACRSNMKHDSYGTLNFDFKSLLKIVVGGTSAGSHGFWQRTLAHKPLLLCQKCAAPVITTQ